MTMARVLFLFLDGVGIGPGDPGRNPFAAAHMPALASLLGGRPLVEGVAPFEGDTATLLEIDAVLGVKGVPQSASGQAALVTGLNVPQLVGEHYGPKPNPAIAEIIRKGNLFRKVVERGGTAGLLNSYPPRYFQAIESGVRLYSSIPLAVTAAGLELMTAEAMREGRAFAADFTGAGWASQPGFPQAPVYSPEEAGRRLAAASAEYDLAWFDFWPSDFAGHRGDMQQAVGLLEQFDGVLGGLLAVWGDREDMILLSSDHGNLEDLATRGHTTNPVPGLLIGPLALRRRIAGGLRDLTSFAPAILELIFSDRG